MRTEGLLLTLLAVVVLALILLTVNLTQRNDAASSPAADGSTAAPAAPGTADAGWIVYPDGTQTGAQHIGGTGRQDSRPLCPGSTAAPTPRAVATLAAVLAVVQVLSSLIMYGKLMTSAPSCIGALHRWSGGLAVIATVPVVIHRLSAQGADGRRHHVDPAVTRQPRTSPWGALRVRTR